MMRCDHSYTRPPSVDGLVDCAAVDAAVSSEYVPAQPAAQRNPDLLQKEGQQTTVVKVAGWGKGTEQKKRKRISKALINYILRENLSSLQSGAVCLNIN